MDPRSIGSRLGAQGSREPGRIEEPQAVPRIRIVSSFEETGLDHQAWNALASLGTNTVFQTYQWLHTWLSIYGGRCEPLFILASDGTRVTGVAPLLIEPQPSGRFVRFIGDGRADYSDLLARHDPDTIAAIVQGLKAHGRWDVLDLTNVPSESATVATLTTACEAAGFSVMVRDQFVCPTLLIPGNQLAIREILNKPSLRRRARHFDRLGTLTYRDLTNGADIMAYLDVFFSQHVSRWTGRSTPSLFLDTMNQRFYRRLTEAMSGIGTLLFSIVELDGRPIAMHYGFDYAGTITWYKPSFDPAYASGSPGLLLVRHLIARALALDRRELDFTIGDELFKRRFTNHVRKTVHLRVFNDPARYMYERSKRGVMAAVRRAAAHVRRT